MKSLRIALVPVLICLLLNGAACSSDPPSRGAESEVPATKPGSRQIPQPDMSRKVILFLGNSLSAGYNLNPDLAFPALIQNKIDARGMQFEVINAGVSGDTTSGGLRRIDWLLKRPVSVLFLELGANDGLRGVDLDVTEKNLEEIVRQTLDAWPEARILIAGMMIPPNMGPLYANRFRQLFVDLADRHKATLIPFLLEGVAGRPELNLPDGIHPTPKGHEMVADHVWTFLEPVLESVEQTSKKTH